MEQPRTNKMKVVCIIVGAIAIASVAIVLPIVLLGGGSSASSSNSASASSSISGSGASSSSTSSSSVTVTSDALPPSPHSVMVNTEEVHDAPPPSATTSYVSSHSTSQYGTAYSAQRYGTHQYEAAGYHPELSQAVHLAQPRYVQPQYTQPHHAQYDDVERQPTPQPRDELRWPAYASSTDILHDMRTSHLGGYDFPTSQIMRRPSDAVGPWERVGALVSTDGTRVLPLFTRQRGRSSWDKYNYRTVIDKVPLEIGGTRSQWFNTGDTTTIQGLPETFTVQLYEEYR